MSSSESDDITNKQSKKFIPKLSNDLQKLEKEKLLTYIEEIHVLIQQQEHKTKKWKKKYKKLKLKCVDKPPKSTANSDTTALAATKTTEDGSKEAGSSSTNAAMFVDEIRQAAEQAQNLNGFIYEPTSGLYYDQKTGYYYNAEYGLYYDGNTGCYYKYNQDKNSFEFHSQVQVKANEDSSQVASCSNDYENKYNSDFDDDDDDDVEFDKWGVITDENKLREIKEKKWRELGKKKEHRNQNKTKKELKRKKLKRKRKKRSRRSSQSYSDSDESKHKEMEDGEISSSTESSTSERDSKRSDDERKEKNVPIFTRGSRFQDIAKKYPPSLRMIIQETNLENLKVGSLHLITYKGGSLGREGKHDVIIPDVNISKTHLKFNYDKKNAVYKCLDLGSRNGTILNGVRMSESKEQSASFDLVHGSILQVGQTKLLCHVHDGNSTCGLCEPGLLIETTREIATCSSNTLTHKEQLKVLQKRYGLESEKFVENKSGAGNYNDRAATRRTIIGSTNENEKTAVASVETAISSENKGFKMLSKLGWNKGETLGKVNAGLLEPINVTLHEGTKGLGCDESKPDIQTQLPLIDQKRIDTWKKTQQRYQNTDIFQLSDDSSD